MAILKIPFFCPPKSQWLVFFTLPFQSLSGNQRLGFHYKSHKVFMRNWWFCGFIIAGHPTIFSAGDFLLVGRWHRSGVQMVTHSPQTPHYNLKYCAQVFNSYLLFNAFSALKLFFQKTQPKVMIPILFIAENLLLTKR